MESDAAIVIEIQQRIREPVEREPDFAKTAGELFINVAKITAPGGRVGRDELVVRATDLFVKCKIGRAAQAAALSVLVKNAAQKKRIIADMRPEQERRFVGR